MQKKQFLMLLLLTGYAANILAQGAARQMNAPTYPLTTVKSKAIIDSTAINHWVRLGTERALSNDGNYFMYTIDNQPTDNQTLIVQSTTSHWKKEFPGASTGIFSPDSRKFIFLMQDTLHFLTLGNGEHIIIANVQGYGRPRIGHDEWLAYQLNNVRQELVLLNLLTGEEQHFNDVADYQFDTHGNTLLLKRTTRQALREITSLDWVNLASSEIFTVWFSGTDHYAQAQLNSYSLDESGTQVAFILQYAHKNSLWYYRVGMDKPVEKVGDQTAGIAIGLSLVSSSQQFSEDGRYLYFLLEQQPESHKPVPDGVSVDLWSYKDSLIQSTQLLHAQDRLTYTAVIGTETDRVIQLTNDYETVNLKPTKGDFAIVSYDRMRSGRGDMYWLTDQKRHYLVSLRDGSKKPVHTDGNSLFWFSPGGRYLLYFDMKTKQYYSYNLKTGTLKALSASIPAGWLAYQSKYWREEPSNIPKPPAFGGVTGCWLDNDKAVWVYDNYDMWQMDLEGKQRPLNITHGYGRAHNIELRLVNQTRYDHYIVHAPTDSILLVAYNTDNKYNGFFRLVPGRQNTPELLVMGPWTWYHLGMSGDLDDGMRPLKAKIEGAWIVKRQSTTEAPNYFLTRDFKTYRPLTGLQPHKDYNWLTAELISWKQLDGTRIQGILYKPENFDPSKKYPVLIHYYEQMSHRLYEFPNPEFAMAQPNIPWFVSRGYLVLTPDIYYTNSIIGEGAKNSVVSAGQYLSKLPFVDAHRMGIAGHSYGGHETYYLITHTHLFAAVLASAGCTDVIGESLALASYEASNGTIMYDMAVRMGRTTLWQNPERYIDESAVFLANKVVTPLLILQNKNDDHWSSGVGFFIALRRLNKRVWMLQYDQEGHVLGIKKNQIDFTTRMTQFFDYYLKSSLPPVWMTSGVPARLKGIATGLELDSMGRKP